MCEHVTLCNIGSFTIIIYDWAHVQQPRGQNKRFEGVVSSDIGWSQTPGGVLYQYLAAHAERRVILSDGLGDHGRHFRFL